jgi:CopG family nickel-responsive transcriptional regulator
MKAPVEEVTTYANALFLERGVLHGQVALIPLGEETTFHSHGTDAAHSHTHLRILGTF